MIRKGFLPQADGRTEGRELNASEKVFSRALEPCPGDEAACFERGWLVVQMVDDKI